METSTFLEKFFDRFNEKLSSAKQAKLLEVALFETDAKEYCSKVEQLATQKLNISRNDLLENLFKQRDLNLKKVLSYRIRFIPSHTKLNVVLFDDCLNHKNNFNVLDKLKYLHILPVKEMADIDLFDFKYLKCKIRFSLLVSINTIFTLIDLEEDNYVLRTHKINQSSFQTAREIVKKSIVFYDFVVVNKYLYFLYQKQMVNSIQLEKYDCDMNMIESVGVDFLNIEILKLITNKFEIIVDFGCMHIVFDLNLKQIADYGQNRDFKEPFYCNHSTKLLNISKDFLFYLMGDESKGKSLLALSRKTGVPFVTIELAFTKQHDWYFFHLIDYASRILIKPFGSKNIFYINLSSNKIMEPYLIQNKFDLHEYGLDALFKNLNSNTENCLILYKNDKYTRRFKHIFII